MFLAAGNPSVSPNVSLLREQEEAALGGIWTCKPASPGDHQGPSLVTLTVQCTAHRIKLKPASEVARSGHCLLYFFLSGRECLPPPGGEGASDCEGNRPQC